MYEILKDRDDKVTEIECNGQTIKNKMVELKN